MVTLNPHHLTPHYRLLHRIVASVVEPTGHLSDISATRADFLYVVGRGYSIYLAHRMWSSIMSYSRHPPGTTGVPSESLSWSAARAHLDASDIPVAERIQPCPP
ncbi:hypothetical protein U1Q18_039052, partial [Sarracenia purpurea var. burkii]